MTRDNTPGEKPGHEAAQQHTNSKPINPDEISEYDPDKVSVFDAFDGETLIWGRDNADPDDRTIPQQCARCGTAHRPDTVAAVRIDAAPPQTIGGEPRTECAPDAKCTECGESLGAMYGARAAYQLAQIAEQ